MPTGPGRDEVLALLAAFGDRAPEEVPEGIDSMELAWLAYQLEQHHGRHLDDDTLARMTTVSAVVEVLGGLSDQ
ncbi:hypothetical protein KCMC57_up61150 [Kitasatospora sp. CMC57]|uniref:Carrier domain-containing protein n=1 Tax=Kitasatospora sp. CMC57 TaxID=3231513 RepID=A0AB33KB75_9ACTN